MSTTRWATFVGAAALVSAALLMPSTAAAAAPAVGHDASATATVQWVDAATGKVTKTWTGSQAEATVIAEKEAAALPPVTTEPKQTQIPPAATNISRQSPCTANTGYFEVHNYPPLVCFANAGSINVYIDQVYKVANGNNQAAFGWRNSAGTRFVTTMPTKYSTTLFNARVVVLNVTIN